MKVKFGTDGIRGLANRSFTPEMCFAIGAAAGRVVAGSIANPVIAIGRDTRLSGPMLAQSLASGFSAAGCRVHDFGVLPTGTVSHYVRHGEYCLGAVVSASHNPAQDNGVKLFGDDGSKASDSLEREVERLVEAGLGESERPAGDRVGEILYDSKSLPREPRSIYMDRLRRFEGAGRGLKIAVDYANGAATAFAEDFEKIAKAHFERIGDKPDGTNINLGCGATKPIAMQETVKSRKCDLGIAFDGDADRAIFCDSQGRLINGDRMMSVWVAARHMQTMLMDNLVGTVMSNTGFEKFLNERNVQFHRAKVGDKNVSLTMNVVGAQIGGEQSGHIIIPDNGPTGDGLFTALEFLMALQEGHVSPHAVVDLFDNFPQIMINVEVADKEAVLADEKVLELVEQTKQTAGDGRVSLRASGTQQMVRVMVESPDRKAATGLSQALADMIVARHKGRIYEVVDLTEGLGE